MKMKVYDEKTMRKMKVPKINDINDLTKYISGLLCGKHNYGTCVYAMSMASVAVFNYMAHKLGVTGFQASCAELDILRRTRLLEDGFMLIDYNKLLYPQYLNSEHFPSYDDLINDNIEHLSKRAKISLKQNRTAHPDVIRHWEYLVARGRNKVKRNNCGVKKKVV